MLMASINGEIGREGRYIAAAAAAIQGGEYHAISVSILSHFWVEEGRGPALVAGIVERCAARKAASGWLLNRPGSCCRAFVHTAYWFNTQEYLKREEKVF